jgi:hypothetical protein
MANELGELPFEATGVLTAADLAKAREAAHAKVQKELYDKAFKQALDDAEREARIAAGLSPLTGPTKPDEPMLRVTINVPESVTPLPAIVIDGRPFYHGFSYELRESQAMQLHAMQAAAWKNDDRMTRGVEHDMRRTKPQSINGRTGQVTGAPIALVGSIAA